MLLECLRAGLAGRPDVVTAWLFGSRARGRERANSDVDVAVIFAAPSADPWRPIRLEGELEARVRLPVQVIDVERAPADLVHRVLRDGVLLRDADPSRRIAVEVKRRMEYFDLQPLLRSILHPGSA